MTCGLYLPESATYTYHSAAVAVYTYQTCDLYLPAFWAPATYTYQEFGQLRPIPTGGSSVKMGNSPGAEG